MATDPKHWLTQFVILSKSNDGSCLTQAGKFVVKIDGGGGTSFIGSKDDSRYTVLTTEHVIR